MGHWIAVRLAIFFRSSIISRPMTREVSWSWRVACALQKCRAGQLNKIGKGGAMDFGFILLISNTLMAVFLYVLVKLIWQE